MTLKTSPSPEELTRKFLSVVTPAYCEESNLNSIYEEIRQTLEKTPHDWQWIVVDDHSTDRTFDVITELAEKDPRVQGLRLSRNGGTHAALFCGLDYAIGDCAIIIMGDGQEPAYAIADFLRTWEQGVDVVWGERQVRLDEGKVSGFVAKIYYGILKKIDGFENLDTKGSDFVLIDRKVINVLLEFSEKNISIFALLHWIGFNQTSVPYKRSPRLYGVSGWSTKKKLKLFLDTMIAFSVFPIRFTFWLGITLAASGIVYAVSIIYNTLTIGQPVEGWASLMVGILIIGGIQLIMLSVLGEYLWRTLDEARNRPRYLVEKFVGDLKLGK